MKQKTLDFLEAHKSEQPSTFTEDAKWRQENEVWLKWSRGIALSIVDYMQANSLSRSDIANKLGVTPQYVSRILSGNTNFSFKSVAEIERKLGISCMEAAMAYHLPHQPRRHCSQTHQSGYHISCEAKTLNYLKILQEFSKIPELTPRILENSPKF